MYISPNDKTLFYKIRDYAIQNNDKELLSKVNYCLRVNFILKSTQINKTQSQLEFIRKVNTHNPYEQIGLKTFRDILYAMEECNR